MRLHHRLARMLNPEAVADVLESSSYSERCRCEHRRFQVLEQSSTQDVGDRNRRCLQEDVVLRAAPGAAFDPEDGVALVRFQNESELHPHLFYASGQGVYFLGLVVDGVQLAGEMQQSILQAEILIAIFFQKFRAVLKREAALAWRNQ